MHRRRILLAWAALATLLPVGVQAQGTPEIGGTPDTITDDFFGTAVPDGMICDADRLFVKDEGALLEAGVVAYIFVVFEFEDERAAKIAFGTVRQETDAGNGAESLGLTEYEKVSAPEVGDERIAISGPVDDLFIVPVLAAYLIVRDNHYLHFWGAVRIKDLPIERLKPLAQEIIGRREAHSCEDLVGLLPSSEDLPDGYIEQTEDSRNRR